MINVTKTYLPNKEKYKKYVDEIDYSADDSYKPGLYLQTERFLDNQTERLCTIE